MTREDEVITEWQRADGYATVRLRRRDDGGAVIRLDVMEQAVDGRVYKREQHADPEVAAEQAAIWRGTYNAADDES